FAEEAICQATAVIGFLVLGIQVECLVRVLKRFLGLPEHGFAASALGINTRIHFVHAEQTIVVRDGAGEIVEQIAKISDAQNEIRIGTIGVNRQSPFEIGDSFVFLAETSMGHAAVGNGHNVFGVKFDGFVEVLERRLVIVQFIAIIGAAIVVTKGVPRCP